MNKEALVNMRDGAKSYQEALVIFFDEGNLGTDI